LLTHGRLLTLFKKQSLTREGEEEKYWYEFIFMFRVGAMACLFASERLDTSMVVYVKEADASSDNLIKFTNTTLLVSYTL